MDYPNAGCGRHEKGFLKRYNRDEHCRSIHKMKKSQIKQFDSKRKAKTSDSDRKKLLDKLPTELGARTMPASYRSSGSKPGGKVLSETDGNARSGISVPRRMSIELEEARQEDILDVWRRKAVYKTLEILQGMR